jgi:hypothetical protein
MREVRLKSDAAADGFEDRQNDLADGTMQLRDGLGDVVARLGAVEPRGVARAPGDELVQANSPACAATSFIAAWLDPMKPLSSGPKRLK